ncbi:MAG: hypothetical protein SGILL_007602, partial [Bacillariaceae sp.]
DDEQEEDAAANGGNDDAVSGSAARHSSSVEEQQPPPPPPQDPSSRTSHRQGTRDEGEEQPEPAEPAAAAAAAAEEEETDVDMAAAAAEDKDDSSDGSLEIPTRRFQKRNKERYEKHNKGAIQRQTKLALRPGTSSQGSSEAVAKVSQESGSGDNNDDGNNNKDGLTFAGGVANKARELLKRGRGPDRFACMIRNCKKACFPGTIACKDHQSAVKKTKIRQSGQASRDEAPDDDGEDDRGGSTMEISKQSGHSTHRSSLKASRNSLGASHKSVSILEEGKKNRKSKTKEASSRGSSSMFRSKTSNQSMAGSGSRPGSSQGSRFTYKSKTKGGTIPSQFSSENHPKVAFRDSKKNRSSSKKSQESTRDGERMPPPSHRGKSKGEDEDVETVTSLKPPAVVSPDSLDPSKRKRDNIDDEELSMNGLEEEQREEAAQKKPRSLPMDEDEISPEKHDEEIPEKVFSSPLKPPEAGIVVEIHVKNFMNHRNMKVELGPNINFIHGQNGSGKSALLAALQIALGARAHSTQRGKRVKDMIRKGNDGNPCRQAVIRVTFKNAGVDAYEPDVYGEMVTIERKINSSGVVEMHLKDHQGKIKSSSKADLVDMLDMWNTHVENPVAILTQESAKHFIQGSSHEKYNFFEGATGLRRLRNLYEEADFVLKDIGIAVTRLDSSFDDDRNAMMVAKREYDQYQKVVVLEQRKEAAEEGLAWAECKECEENVVNVETSMTAELTREKDALNALEEEQLKVADDEASLRERLEALKAEMKESYKDTRHTKKVKKEENSSLRSLRIELNATRREMRTVKNDLAEAESALESKRNAIARQADEAHTQAQDRSRRRERAEQTLSGAEQELVSVQSDITSIQSRKVGKEAEVDAARRAAAEARRFLEECNKNVEALNRSAGNSVAIFGPHCAELERLVEAEKSQFQDEVIGPIGAYCRIVEGKKKFGPLAQLAIENVLDRFVVFNDHDRKVFQQLRNKCGPDVKCNVFQVSRHTRYNVPDPPEGVETVAGILDVSNDDVFNCLFDFKQKKKKSVFSSKEESERRLLRRDANGRHCLATPHIKEIRFLPHGDTWHLGRNGRLTLMSHTRKLKLTLGVDVEAALQDARLQRQTATSSARERQQTLQNLQSDHETIKMSLQGLIANQRKLKNRIRQARSEIEDIERDENDAADDQDKDTSEEEAEIKRLTESWSSKDARCTSILKRYGDTMSAITEKEKELAEENARY